MAGSTYSQNGWIVWLTFLIGMLLSVSPLPQFMEILRPQVGRTLFGHFLRHGDELKHALLGHGG